MGAPLDYLRTTSSSSSEGSGALDYLRKKKKEDEGVNVQNEIANSKSRLASVGVRNVDTTTKNNVLMDVLTLLSKFNYAGDNAMKEFIDRGDPNSATPGQFDPLQAWKRGWSLQETPTLTDSFARMGLSDKEWFNVKGPLGIEIKPSVAGIAGLATSFLNPLNPLNFAGLGLTAKGVTTGAKGLSALEKAFGPEVAAKMAASLGDDAIEGLGARTVGDIAGQLGKRGNFSDLIKEGLAATGANASTRLPYNGTRKLTAEFALPSIPFVTPYKKLGEVAIPGTQHIVNAAGAVGRGVKSTGIGDWFGKNFSTKFVSNKVPGEVALRKMNIASKIDEYITSLETSGEHPTTLSMLRELKDELENVKLANGEVNVPAWQTDPKEWFNPGNPINDIFSKYGVTLPEGETFAKDINVNLDIDGQAGNTVNKMAGQEAAPTYYSKLQQTIEKRMPNKMTVGDFQNWVKAQGIKAEELKWSQIDQIQGPVVTKQSALGWLRDHDVKVTSEIREGDATNFRDYSVPGGKDYKEMLIKWDNPSTKENEHFNQSHWGVPDVIAHARFDTREIDGKKVLYVQEIQSDWHQAGRQKGYHQGLVPPQEYDELAKKWLDIGNKIDEFRNIVLKADEGSPEYLAARDQMTLLDRERSTFFRQLNEAGWGIDVMAGKAIEKGMPQGPYQKGWEDLAVKQIIDYATKNNFDSIKFTKGDDIAEAVDTPNPESLAKFYGDILPNKINKYIRQWGTQLQDNTFDLTPEIKNQITTQGQPLFKMLNKEKEVAPTFYSKLQQTVEKKMQNKMTTTDFQNWISKQGIKAEELKWADIQSIAGTDGVVTKQEVMDWVKSHDIQIEEVVRGGRAPKVTQEFRDNFNWSKDLSDTDIGEIMDLGDEADEISSALEHLTDNDDELDSMVNGVITFNQRSTPSTKFGGYTVPGGKDYQEMLLRWGNPTGTTKPLEWKPTEGDPNFLRADDDLIIKSAASEPGKFELLQKLEDGEAKGWYFDSIEEAKTKANELKGLPKGIEWQSQGNNYFNSKDFPNKDYISIHEYDGDWRAAYHIDRSGTIEPIGGNFSTLEEAKAAAEAKYFEKFGKPKLYNSSHWDESNVLAHVRYDTRTVDGKKVLFIQEVQSDWHQAGRKQGYVKETKDFPREVQPYIEEYKALDKESDKLMEGAIDETDGMDPIQMLAFVEKGGSYKEGMDRITARQDELRKLMGEDVYTEAFHQLDKVKNAPFSKNWDELTMKRMLRYAAENGYDKVAWATGKQNASHYGLEKQVDKLTYDVRNNSLWGFKGGSRVFSQEVLPKDLPGYVGENVAKQLLSEEKPVLKIVEPDKPKVPKDLNKMSKEELQNWMDSNKGKNEYKVVDQWGNVWFSGGEGPAVNNRATLQRVADMGERHVTADLSVGGSGMRGFYDEMLPMKMDKYLKQWGQKTGEIDLNKQTIEPVNYDIDELKDYIGKEVNGDGPLSDWEDGYDLGRRISEELKNRNITTMKPEDIDAIANEAADFAGLHDDAVEEIKYMMEKQVKKTSSSVPYTEQEIQKAAYDLSDALVDNDWGTAVHQVFNDNKPSRDEAGVIADRIKADLEGNYADEDYMDSFMDSYWHYIEGYIDDEPKMAAGPSMQKAFDITPEMRDSVMYQGQPMFKQNMTPPEHAGNFAENILGVVRDGKTLTKEAMEAMAFDLGVEYKMLKKMVNEIATTLKRQDKQIKTANTVDFNKWVGNYLKDPALRDDFLRHSDDYAQKDWKEILTDLKELDPGLTDAQAFKNAMYIRSLSDAIYDKVPDELKPYYTGLIKPEHKIGGRAGKEAIDTTGIATKDLHGFNSGIIINYEGVNIFYPFNKGVGFNNLNMDDFKKLFKSIDSYKLKEETKLRGQVSIDPVNMRPGYGGRTNSTTDIWVNPITVKERSQDWLNDVISHEIGHGIEKNSGGVVTPTQYDVARNQDAILSLSKFDNATDPDDIYQTLLNMSNTRASDKDLQYFADAIYDLKNKNKGYISDYAKESADKSAALGFRESIAEDFAHYNINPELFRELFPARTKILDQMIEESTRTLMPYQDYIKAISGEVDKVTENYGKHMAEINKRIEDIVSQEGFEFVGGATAAGEVRKDLSKAFHNAQIKSQDFIQQVETIFKDMNVKQRREIMAAAAEGTELDDPRMMEVLNSFIKWRESVVKSYNDLGVPIRALDKYVPFIPVRALKKNESKLLNEVYGTGAELDGDQLMSYLFDVDPNLQHRTTRAANPAEVNELLGKEWLTEDAALAMAIRGTRAIKAQESIGFMNGFIEKYGLPIGQLKGKMPEGYQFYTQTIESSGKPTLTVAKDAGVEGVFAIPSEFAETINNYMAMIHDPRASNEFLRLYDKATSFYKKAAYLWNPGHLGRDALGNIFNGWLMGNQDLRTYGNSARAMFNYLHGDQKMTFKVGGKKMTSKELWDTARDYGLVDIGMVMAETPHEMVQGLKGGKNLHFYTNLMGDLSRTNDTWTRLANFMYNLDKGMSLDEAAVTTKKFLFDYFDLTPTERKVMTRIVPFYTFMRKNLPIQVESLVRNPRPFSQVNTTANYITGEYQDNDERPQSLKDTVAAKMGEAWVAPNLPMNDLAKIPTNRNSVSNLMASINPLIRTPLEMTMNKQIFSNREIEQYDGEMQNLPMTAAIKKLTGDRVELPQVERNGIGYALEQMIPTLRNLDIVTDPENSRQQARQVSMAGGPALYADEQVKNNRLYEKRDALRAAISKISDSGVEVPTTTDIENSEKVNMRPKEWLLFKKQMMAQGYPEPSITDFENAAKIGMEIEPYLKVRTVAVELDISGPTATDYEYANKVGIKMEDYLQLKAEAKKRDVAAPTAADFGRASDLGISIVDFLDVKARAKAAGVAIDKYIKNGGR